MPVGFSKSALRIAALQPHLEPDGGSANFAAVRKLVDDAAAESSLDLVVLPELFDGVLDAPAGQDSSEAVRSYLAELARTYNVNVVGGSVLHPMPGGQPRNACFVFDRQGGEVGRYDKRVLFSKETQRRSPGDAAGIFQLGGLRVGVLICGDLWPPELARELAGRVDVLCVPAKTGVPNQRHSQYARQVWTSLALTRAMENGLVVAVSDWAAGRHEVPTGALDNDDTSKTYWTSGAATICDPGYRPDMDRIQRRFPDGQSGALVADVDLNALAKYREYRQSVGLLPL